MNFSIGFDELVLDPPGVAAVLKISERQVLDLRQQDPSFPAPQMCGANRPRWHLLSILDWVLAGGTSPADGPPVDAPTPTQRGRRAPRVH